jgi:hypothetical protein
LFHQIQKIVVSQIIVRVAKPRYLDRYRNSLAMETPPKEYRGQPIAPSLADGGRSIMTYHLAGHNRSRLFDSCSI